MKTFSNFIVEAAGSGFAKMSDADFERWVKANPAAADKARKVRDAARGVTSVKPPLPGANQAARGAGFLKNVRGVAGAAWKLTKGIGGRALGVLNAPVIGDMLDPQGTSAYDQVTGPNAYYNAPGYKGPKPQPGASLADINRQAADQFKPKPKPAAPAAPAPRSAAPGAQAAPKPAAPQKSARQQELDSINADKSLTPMQKWAKANPKLAAAKAERDRTRGTSSTTNPLMKDMKSRMPAAAPAAPAAKPVAKTNTATQRVTAVSQPAAASVEKEVTSDKTKKSAADTFLKSYQRKFQGTQKPTLPSLLNR